jgi:hypothetical protein
MQARFARKRNVDTIFIKRENKELLNSVVRRQKTNIDLKNRIERV